MSQTTVSREDEILARMQARADSAAISDDDRVVGRLSPKRAVVWALMLMLLVPAFSGAFSVLSSDGGSMPAAFADEETDEELSGEDYSFYRTSAVLTDYFSYVQNPGNDDVWSTGFSNNPGAAGALLGYPDSSFLDDPFGWASSAISGSSDNIGYESLVSQDSDGNTLANQGFYEYATYGAALADMGLDDTSTTMSLTFGKMISGGIMMLFFIFVYAVDMLFYVFLSLIQILNPFSWIYDGVVAAGTPQSMADGMVQGDTSTPGFLQGIVNWIAGWYVVLNDIAWMVMVPIFIGILVIGLLLFKNMNKGSAIKKNVIRVFFIGLGLPLLGAMFTASLNSLIDTVNPDGAGRGASQVVMSTYVDFEGWVHSDRLAVPNGAVIEWDNQESSATGPSMANVRNTALAINNQTYSALNLDPVVGGDGNEGIADWSEEAMNLDSTGESGDTFLTVTSLLNRYMSGSVVSASSFETEMKGVLSDSAVDEAVRSEGGFDNEDGLQSMILYWFDMINDNEGDDFSGTDENGVDIAGSAFITADYIDDRSEEIAPYGGPASLVSNPLVGFNNNSSGTDATGLSSRSLNEEGGQVDSSAVSARAISFYSRDNTMTGCGSQNIHWGGGNANNADSRPLPCNMSPLAMFNYLNTEFGSTSMTTFSAGNVMSGATREFHTSVNQVGTGTLAAIYWVNAIVLLGAFVILGIVYALSMFFGAFKRGIQVLTSIPFAVLGAVGGIAKIIIYTFALIMEILVTIFLYMFLQEFLLTLPQIIEAPIANSFLNPGDDDGFLGFTMASGFIAAMLASPGFAIVVGVISILAVLGFTIFALRIRKTVIKAIDEAVTKLVEKLLDTQAAPAAGGGGAMGGALGSAAGAAGANRLMSRGAGGGASAGSVPGSSGPDAPGGSSGDGPGSVPGAIGPGGGNGSGGDSNSPDGSNESGGPGITSGDESGVSHSGDKELGQQVAGSGLSQDGNGHGFDMSSDDRGEDGTETNVGDDAGSDMQESIKDSQESYAEADRSKLEAGKDTVEAGVDAAEAGGRAAAGDEVGAAQKAQDAAGHAQDAGESLKESSEHEKEAGEMNMEKDSSQTGTESVSSADSQSEQASETVGPAGSDSAEHTAENASDHEASEQASSVEASTESGQSDSQLDSQTDSQSDSSVDAQSSHTDGPGSKDSGSDGPDTTVGGTDATSTSESNTAEGNQIGNQSTDVKQRNEGGDSNLSQENVDGSSANADNRTSNSSVREGDTNEVAAKPTPNGPKDGKDGTTPRPNQPKDGKQQGGNPPAPKNRDAPKNQPQNTNGAPAQKPQRPAPQPPSNQNGGKNPAPTPPVRNPQSPPNNAGGNPPAPNKGTVPSRNQPPAPNNRPGSSGNPPAKQGNPPSPNKGPKNAGGNSGNSGNGSNKPGPRNPSPLDGSGGDKK